MKLRDKFCNPVPEQSSVRGKGIIVVSLQEMGRRKKNSESLSEGNSLASFRLTSRETFNTILGILALLVSAFLFLAAFEAAGKVGNLSFSLFSYLFGIGYYLMPMVILLLGISLLNERGREFAFPQIFGSALLFLSALGLINLLSTKGGVAGRVISGPLVGLFDVYVTALILVALVAIGIIVIFDVSLKMDLVRLFRKIFFRDSGIKEGNALEEAAINKAVQEVERIAPSESEARARIDSMSKSKKLDSDGFMPMVLRKSGKAWTPPPLSLLEKDIGKPGVGDIKANANLIKRTLLNFGIVVEMDEISIGPSVTRYAMKPAEGVKLSKILGLQTNLELALAAHPVRIEAPIPGKSLVGIEVPNTAKSTIGLGSLLSESEYTESDKPLLIALGKNITGNSVFDNVSKMPHLLIAGATGSGKSVTIHAIINSLLYRNPPENLKLIMIDPKRVELTLYNGIPHLLTPVI
ncbi:MAG: DNA translocase FtsK 4TM domain-containing protein, partial [Patescibacteria group bacterium]